MQARPISGGSGPMSAIKPLEQKKQQTETVGSTFAMKYQVSSGSALPAQKPFSLEQTPPPLPSGTGSTKVMVEDTVISRMTPMPNKGPFILNQTPPPLPSALGSVKVFNMQTYAQINKPMPGKRPFSRSQYPEPLQSRIGEDDLPGGFRGKAVLSGMASPLYDLARGIVQIDDIKVLFDVRA